MSAAPRKRNRADNLHATMVVLGDCGVVIVGESGAGKTMLGLTLVDRWQGMGLFARLVSDDQIFVSASGGRVIGAAPASIASLAEARGFGPAPVSHEPCAVIDLAVQLGDRSAAPRIADGESLELAGQRVPLLRLPAHDVAAASLAAAAALGVPPFRPGAEAPFGRGWDDD